MVANISEHKFIWICLLAGLLVVTATALYNYKANRWGIYADDYQTFHGRIRPNRHWLKTDYLISETHEYDCVLFGSSRVGSIDQRRLTGRCYNFTHSGGLPSNHLIALKTFLRKGLKLKRVYLGLDDISYQWNPDDNQSQHLRRGYPTDLFDWLDAQLFYLLQPIELKNLGLVTGRIPRQPLPHHVVDPLLDWQRIDQESQAFFRQPKQRDATLKMLRGTVSGGAYYGERAAVALSEFVELARKEGIEVVLFFNPLHYKTYLTRVYENYLDFKRRVAEVSGYYDFTGLNQYTTDNRYWKETSHYTSIVGNRIADILTGEPPARGGFGRYVTAEDLDSLERQQLQTDRGYLETLIRREVLLGIPQRFVSHWFSEGRLVPQSVLQPRGEENTALIAGGQISLSRGSAPAEYRPGVWTRLARGDLFVVRYDVQSNQRSRVDFKVRQSESQVGGAWRSYRVYIAPGTSSGYVAGYVTRKRTPIRLQLERGTVRQSWQPLALYTLGSESEKPQRGAE